MLTIQQNAAAANEMRTSRPRSIVTLNSGSMATLRTRAYIPQSSETCMSHMLARGRGPGSSRFAEGAVMSKLGMALICHVVDPADTDGGISTAVQRQDDLNFLKCECWR